MAERCRVFKRESVATGGDAADDEIDLTPINPAEDFVDARGITFQEGASNDEDVGVSRDSGGNMTFKDGVVSGTKTLTDLLTGLTEAQHKALRVLTHLASGGGPFEGFATNAFRETLPAADPFPTSIIWWESSAKTEKIVERTIAYNANKTVNTDQWKVYDTDGTTLLATVTDTIAYTTVFETSRTRTIV